LILTYYNDRGENRLLNRLASTRSTCALLLIASLSLAQPTPRSKILEQRRKQYPELSRIVDLAQAVPPEFSASFLLRVATSQRLRDRDWKKELLEQAFQSAGQAQQPIRRKVIAAGHIATSRAEVLTMGFDQRLDRLSLQSLATTEMLPLDKTKALEMFQAISFPRLHELQCEDALVDHVSDYYGLLGHIVGAAFTPQDLRDGRHVELLNYEIGKIASPVQLGPLASLLSSAALSPEELKSLAGSFAAALERIRNDDRSFSASLPSTDEELHRFVEVLRAKSVMPDVVIAGYRRYLLRNFTGNRCADNVGKEDLLREVGSSFNGQLASDANPNLAPLAAEELKPAKVEGKANLEPFFEEAEFQAGMQDFLELLTGKGHGLAKQLSDEQKDTAEWRERFDDFLRRIDELKAGVGEPEYRYFYRKATALQALLRVAPPGPEQDKVVRKFVAFLASSNFQQESLLEWYAQVERTASAVKGLKAATYAKFLDELQASGHPVLILYAAAAAAL
jgi:hypothetical protein